MSVTCVSPTKPVLAGRITRRASRPKCGARDWIGIRSVSPARLSAESSLRVLGFVTRDALSGLKMPDHVAVYFPQSYNFAGQLAVVPREHVELLEAPSSEVMTFIVSGGISGFGRGQSLVPPPTLTSVNIKPPR